MATYLDDPPPAFRAIEEIGKDSCWNVTEVCLSSHTGTHVDAPRHLLKEGRSIDNVPLRHLIGYAKVIEVTQSTLTVEHFQTLPIKPGMIILLKTGESAHLEQGTFTIEYVAPRKLVAQWLVDQGIKAIGIDTLSIEGGTIEEVEAHPVFLEANIPIIEGLNLSQVPEGDYFFVCLPLKLRGLDSAPARAILIDFEDTFH